MEGLVRSSWPVHPFHNAFPALHSEPNVLDESQGLLDEGNLSRYNQCEAPCVCLFTFVCAFLCVKRLGSLFHSHHISQDAIFSLSLSYIRPEWYFCAPDSCSYSSSAPSTEPLCEVKCDLFVGCWGYGPSVWGVWVLLVSGVELE